MRLLHHLHIRVWQKHCLIAGPRGTTPSELLCFYNKLLDRYNAMMDKLAVAQHKMDCIVLGITLRDQKWNTWIHQETGVSNIINAIRKVKHRWAGQIAQLSDNRGTIRATEWTKRDWIRKIRWRDNLTRQFVPVWSRLTKHRRLWDRPPGIDPGRSSSVKSECKPWLWWWWGWLLDRQAKIAKIKLMLGDW